MGKTTKRHSDAAATAQAVEVGATVDKVRTMEGREVPAAELEHIAPALRAFAVPVESLKRDLTNARVHGDEDLATTAVSLREFGQQHLVHFDTTTRVIKVGNGRHGAASAVLGWKWIAAVPSNLDADRLRAFALADNRTAEKSGWDYEALQRELDALGDLSIDMAPLGFAAADLEELEAELAGETYRMKPRRKARDADESGGAVGDEPLPDTQHKIVIDCRDEAHQAELLRKLKGQGLKVKALTA